MQWEGLNNPLLVQWEGQQLGQWEGLIQPLVQKEGLSSLFSAVGVAQATFSAWEGLTSLFSVVGGGSSNL